MKRQNRNQNAEILPFRAYPIAVFLLFHPLLKAKPLISACKMGEFRMQGVSCWFSIGLKLRIAHVNVGTHGSCVRSNNPAYMPPILLEWTHEPCVPTCNLTHITMQYQPFHRMILPILHDEMGHFCALIGSFRTVKRRTLYQETAHLSS